MKTSPRSPLASNYRITLTVGTTSQWPTAHRRTHDVDVNALWMIACARTITGDPEDPTSTCVCGGGVMHVGRTACIDKVQQQLLAEAAKVEADACIDYTVKHVRSACIARWGGVSIHTVDGSWYDDAGVLQPETSVVATVIVEGGLGREPQLEDEAAQLAHRLGDHLQQDSILITVEPVRSAFIAIDRH